MGRQSTPTPDEKGFKARHPKELPRHGGIPQALFGKSVQSGRYANQGA
jgi:hypothetical protein